MPAGIFRTDKINKLKEKWESEGLTSLVLTSDNEIGFFQKERNLVLPIDLVYYFKTINGSNNEYDNNFYKFYNFQDFKSINDGLKDWNGIPDYSNIVNTLKNFETYYIFADYSINVFTYAIKLYNSPNSINEVLVICGDEFKVISNSFSEFLELYMSDSFKLQFNEG